MPEPYTTTTPTGQTPRDRTPAAVKVDNLLRRRLRISDPGDPREVAGALKRLFPREGQALEREASGLPLVTAPPVAPRPAEPAASGAELDQAVGDVGRDLDALIKDSQLKDIEPELQGWAQTIRGLVADGTAAARVALDPRARDRALAARRSLGDYARLARLVGALTCHHNQAYRRLAQSLDEVGSLILVLIGEALARVGFGGGRFLLQAPASELQARRDAVLLALRNLTGTTQEAYGSKDWPYGLHGLRSVLRLLDESGHADLRAMLEENALGRLMDDLLDRASTVSAYGLRALGATAVVAVQRLNRLVQIIDNRVDPASPPVVAFLEAIRLFVDGFEGSGSGYRLLFIARPPVVFYGLYGIGGPDDATRRLIELVVRRGRLAELLDCYLACNCCQDPAICQAILDKLLYDTDRAIDLYALGADPNGDGEPEWRAAAYGLLIEAFLAANAPGGPPPYPCTSAVCLPVLADLVPTLEAIRDQLVRFEGTGTLRQPLPFASPLPPLTVRPRDNQERLRRMRDELCLERRMDARWGGLLATMAPACVRAGEVLSQIDTLLGDAIDALGLQARRDCPATDATLPDMIEESLADVAVAVASIDSKITRFP